MIYRYSLLHGNKTFKNILMSNYSKVIFGVIIQILAALIGFFVYRMFLPKEVSVLKWILNKTNLTCFQSISGYLNFFKNRGFLSADDGDVVVVLNLRRLETGLVLITIAFTFIGAELISAFFVLLILITLKRNIKSLSHRAYKVHKQFALLLAVQVSFKDKCYSTYHKIVSGNGSIRLYLFSRGHWYLFNGCWTLRHQRLSRYWLCYAYVVRIL